jgi:hypothetical protein
MAAMKLTIDMLRALERRLREAGFSRRITPLLRSRLFKRWLQDAPGSPAISPWPPR